MKYLWILICLSIFPSIRCQRFQRRDHSLVPPYTGGWTTYGTTMISPSFVRLTADQKGSTAGISNIYPLHSRDWEVIIDFKVFGSKGTLFGDGFAFWYTDTPIKPGNALGAEVTFKGLGIFYDTYSNHNSGHGHDYPYVSCMVNNRSIAYDHDHDGNQTQLAGCHSSFRNKNHKTRTRITYSKNTLTVDMDVNHQNEWKNCISLGGVHLPTGYYLGISAATGDLTDTHDILSLKTYDLGLPYSQEEILEDRSMIEPYAELAATPREHVPDVHKTSIWTIFLYIILAIFIFCFCVVGYVVYSGNQRRKRRLY
ncbi:unnamed protein product [Hymenolepis diminuta]|uniref:L-type lectin-like domain-containing protein n=1 Tax=Hymenolepis diminuta TaxID=6216 RepID=A0A0R3SRQ2_HYMDI|nr:unnamed protein product [Hymenolepis diminuta]VUZ47104.1 unnamed protein product [Hymenolepis diminuta]